MESGELESQGTSTDQFADSVGQPALTKTLSSHSVDCEDSDPSLRYKVYGKRWLMLAVLSLFNMSNAMIWISFAPIANHASDYYLVSIISINWFSLVFFITFIPCGIISWWVIGSMGLKYGVLTGTWLNAIGATVRMLASLINIDNKQRFVIALVGQVISGCSQPLALSMPTKLSALWFGDKERTLANTISSLSNPLGVLVANIIASFIVHHGSDIKILVIIFAVPCLLTAALATTSFHTDTPPTPPSASADESEMKSNLGLLQALQNKNFVVLMFTVGFGVAVFSTLTTIVFQVICPKGYGNEIAGVCGAVVVVGGLIGGACSSIYVDRTKQFEYAMKILLLMAGLSMAFISITTNIYDQPVLLALSFAFSGFTTLGVLPICLELGVEVTYPLPEATTSGLQWMTGQVLGIILLLLLPFLGTDFDQDEMKRSKCSSGTISSPTQVGAKDLTNAVLLMSSLTCAVVIFCVIFFKADLRRIKKEFQRRVFSEDEDDAPNASEDH